MRKKAGIYIRNVLLLAILGCIVWVFVLDMSPWSVLSGFKPVYTTQTSSETLEVTSNLGRPISIGVSVNNSANISQVPIMDYGSANSTKNYGIGSNEAEVWVNCTIKVVLLRVQDRLTKAARCPAPAHMGFKSTGPNGTTVYVTTESTLSGVGNWLFVQAALLGLALSNRRYPLRRYDHRSEASFLNISLEKRRQDGTSNKTGKALVWEVMKEVAVMKFTPTFTNLSASKPGKNIIFSGGLQSWKYFDAYRDEVKTLFTFTPTVFNASVAVIRRGLDQLASRKDWSLTEEGVFPSLVSIHVRRGDILGEPFRTIGFTPATEAYLLRTVLHVQLKHAAVVFFVVSNDIAYCKKLFVEDNFVFVENNSAEVELATISLMDFVILTVGTYGWWGAYLSDAKEVYYFKDWPINGSTLHKAYSNKDHFLPSWIPGN